MNKKEKYINFIVDDMVKKTEIDYETMRLTPPSFSSFLFLSDPSLYPSSLPSLFSFLLPHPAFSEYVKERYGAHSEEMGIIWDLYKQRIQSLINNE